MDSILIFIIIIIMLIKLSCRTAICQSVVEVYLTGVAPLGAVSNRFNFLIISISIIILVNSVCLYSID